jgi:hypothetical protein
MAKMKLPKKIKFFTHLVRVKLPDLRCRKGRPCTRSSQTKQKGEVSGVLQVFNTYCKGLKIHQVIVPDCPDHPHSDHDIELALGDADVRILDWRKNDMSISMLRVVAPNIEKLHLYSSGNEDVVEYWSSYLGLSRFPQVGFPNSMQLEQQNGVCPRYTTNKAPPIVECN